MNNMNNLKQIATQKLGKALINLGEKTSRDCWFIGIYEPKISTQLLKSLNK